MKVSYIKKESANVIEVTKIKTVHYYEFAKDFRFEGERHNHWEMVYVDRGQVFIRAGAQDLCLKQGEVVFHKPNEFHTIRADGMHPADVFVISFYSSSAAMAHFRGKVLRVPSKLHKTVAALISECTHTYEVLPVMGEEVTLRDDSPIGGQQMARIRLEEFLIMLIREETAQKSVGIFPSRESMENHLVSELLRRAEENIYGKVSCEELCKGLNYSRAYLSRIFKAATGYTLVDYQIALRIREAKKLLREQSLNVAQISDLLQFDNPQYFARVFKRITNLTPTQYRKDIVK